MKFVKTKTKKNLINRDTQLCSQSISLQAAMVRVLCETLRRTKKQTKTTGELVCVRMNTGQYMSGL